MFPFPTFIPRVTPTSLSLVTSATGETNSIPIPASVEAGDIIVIAIVNSSASQSKASDFTWVAYDGDTNGIFADGGGGIAFKFADGTEAGTTSTGWTGYSPRYALAVFRPNTTASSVTLGNGTGSAGYWDLGPHIEYPTASDKMTLTLGWSNKNLDTFSGGGNNPVSGSGVVTNPSFGDDLYYVTKLPSTAVNVTVDTNDDGINVLISGYIEIR